MKFYLKRIYEISMKKVRKIIRKLTPKSWHLFLVTFYRIFANAIIFLRIQKPITKILGQKWKRSHKYIEVDITHNCNMKCINCSRSCRQAPTIEGMNAQQIKKFVKESIDNKIKWEIIRVMGGEPCLHPNLIKILNILLEYKKKESPNSTIELTTNGFGKKVKESLNRVPEDVKVINTSKKSSNQFFYKFNKAPKDSIIYKFADFSNGCPAIKNVGFGLNRYGYYPCANAGSIDRVLGFDIGRKKLPSKDDLMRDLLNKFCRYCGIFGYGSTIRFNKEIISKVWKEAYDKYKKKKPKLSLY